MIFRNERTGHIEEAVEAALKGWQSGLWTALPAIIESFDAAAMTCTAQPALKAKVQQKDGTWQWLTMPVLVDVPVVYPGGGGYTLTFPIAAGDEALIVFSARCIDNHWLSGGVQEPFELRMHDLSDGFAIVGHRSQPRVLAGVSTGSVQLRSDDGEAHVEIASGHVVNVVSPSTINLTAPAVNINASSMLTVDSPQQRNSGDILDRYDNNAQTIADMRTTYNEHTHPGDSGGTTGTPNETM